MNKAFFEVLWDYLGPLTQWRMRAVCRDFLRWSTGRKFKLWNIYELLDANKRKMLNKNGLYDWKLDGAWVRVSFLRGNSNVIEMIHLLWFNGCKWELLCRCDIFGGLSTIRRIPRWAAKRQEAKWIRVYKPILNAWQGGRHRKRLFSCCGELARGERKIGFFSDPRNILSFFQEEQNEYRCGWCKECKK